MSFSKYPLFSNDQKVIEANRGEFTYLDRLISENGIRFIRMELFRTIFKLSSRLRENRSKSRNGLKQIFREDSPYSKTEADEIK